MVKNRVFAVSLHLSNEAKAFIYRESGSTLYRLKDWQYGVIARYVNQASDKENVWICPSDVFHGWRASFLGRTPKDG